MTTRGSGGRTAVTHYEVRERIDSPYGKFALLDVRIETGRTHQIRVHMASIGHPVVGDTLYGAAGVLRSSAAPHKPRANAASPNARRYGYPRAQPEPFASIATFCTPPPSNSPTRAPASRCRLPRRFPRNSPPSWRSCVPSTAIMNFTDASSSRFPLDSVSCLRFLCPGR